MEPFGVTILFCLLHISHHGSCHRLPQTSQRPAFPLQVLSTLFPSALPSNLALEPRVFIKERARKRQPRGVDGSAFTLRSEGCWLLWSWPRFDFISSAAQASSVSEVYFRTSGCKRSKDKGGGGRLQREQTKRILKPQDYGPCFAWDGAHSSTWVPRVTQNLL